MNIEEKLLDKAQEYFLTIELYKEKYIKLPTSFSELTLLRKVDLLKDQANRPPFGSNIYVSPNKLARIHRTSGTSAKPLFLTLTENDINNVIETGKKAFQNVGLNSDDIIINCMNYCMWMGGFMDHQSLEATGATVIPYGVGHTDNLIEMILSIGNICIHSTPSYLRRIEQVAHEKFGMNACDLKIKKALLGGEGGASDMGYRKKIEDKFQMSIYDANYGMSEVMSIIASEDSKKNGLVFIGEDTIYPELVSENGESASNQNITEGAIGELVLSNIKKESQPLIRYATGDVIEILEVMKNNPVTKFKFRVLGRSDDMLVIKGINFYPSSIRGIISNCKICTGNYCVRVKNDRILDYIKLLVEVSEYEEEYKMKDVKEYLTNEIRARYFVLVDIEFTDKLDQGKNKVSLIERVNNYE